MFEIIYDNDASYGPIEVYILIDKNKNKYIVIYNDGSGCYKDENPYGLVYCETCSYSDVCRDKCWKCEHTNYLQKTILKTF
jgi:predicted nucleic-acid-binding Zn-ribbon protein